MSGTNDYMLIAVSATNDPTGAWHKYSFDVADMPDYEKFGIWRDGYYMGTNNTSGNDIYVFERSQMLNGLTAQMVGFNNPWRPTTIDGFMRSTVDNDGALQPTGAPGLFIAFFIFLFLKKILFSKTTERYVFIDSSEKSRVYQITIQQDLE